MRQRKIEQTTNIEKMFWLDSSFVVANTQLTLYSVNLTKSRYFRIITTFLGLDSVYLLLEYKCNSPSHLN